MCNEVQFASYSSMSHFYANSGNTCNVENTADYKKANDDHRDES